MLHFICTTIINTSSYTSQKLHLLHELVVDEDALDAGPAHQRHLAAHVAAPVPMEHPLVHVAARPLVAPAPVLMVAAEAALVAVTVGVDQSAQIQTTAVRQQQGSFSSHNA